MIAGFARMQHLENELVPDLLRSAGVDWLVELAPAASPSPGAHVPRHRMLLDDGGWVWPCRLPGGLLPFGDEALPAVLMRHLFWLDCGPDLLRETVRCLKPGGLLVSVSANPFHRGSWEELGRGALQLPAWPRFLMQHGRYDLQLEVPPRTGWRGMIPGVAPLLVLAGRKPPRGNRVRPMRFRRLVDASARPLPTSCRAA
jgi:SAM-dependent methyltransferase